MIDCSRPKSSAQSVSTVSADSDSDSLGGSAACEIAVMKLIVRRPETVRPANRA